MPITLLANPAGNDTALQSPAEITLRSSLNVLSAFNNPGFARPFDVYGQPGLLPIPTTPNYAQASTAHYSLASLNSFSPGNIAACGGSHFKFFTNAPSAYTNPSNFAPAPTANFANATQANGTILQPAGFATISYSTSSDYRLKKNISPIENGLNYIMPLRPRKFTWKTSLNESVGFIAHELKEDLPVEISQIIVTGEKDAAEKKYFLYKDGVQLLNAVGDPELINEPTEEQLKEMQEAGYTCEFAKEEIIPQQISVRALISPLVASVQHLKKLYDEQELEIQELESRMTALKQRR